MLIDRFGLKELLFFLEREVHKNWLNGKESACNAEDLGSVPGLGRSPGGGYGNPLQYSCLEDPHGWNSLVGYSPWSCKELDMTEQLSTLLCNYCYNEDREQVHHPNYLLF